MNNDRRFHLFAFFILSAVIFVIYANALRAQFVFDDIYTIANNPAVRHLEDPVIIWHSFNTRFITGLSFAFNYALGGLNVVGYHLLNIAAHVAAAFLVYRFIFLTFKTPVLKNDPLAKEAQTIALLAALLFSAHPIQTESVTFVTQRMTVLSAIFYLSALIFYIKARLEKKTVYRWGALGATILGMFTKENTFTIPLMLVVYEFVFLKGWEKAKARETLKSLAPFFLTLLIIPLSLAADPRDSLYRLRHDLGGGGFVWTNFWTEVDVLRTYFRLLVLPVNQNLDYDYPMSAGPLSPATLGSVVLIGGILSFSVLMFKRRPLISFCIWWIFLTVSVEFAVCAYIARDFIYEHYLYLPIAGFSLGVVYGLRLWVSNKATVIAVCLGFIAAFSVMTYQRNKAWENGVTFWSDVLKKSPYKARPYNNLGYHYALIGEYDRAIDYYRMALVLDPEFTHPYGNLGDAYFQKKNYSEAILYLNKYITLEPERIEPYSTLGLIYTRYKKYDTALENYFKAMQINPRLAQTYVNIGAVYGLKGDYDREISFSRKAVALDSKNAQAYANLCLAYAQKGLYQEAIDAGHKGLKLDKNNSDVYNNLGLSYALQKDWDKAVTLFEEAVRLNPESESARKNLEMVLKKMRE